MRQRLQDTDAFIMMEFDRAASHLKGRPVNKELQLEMAQIAKPFIERLMLNGHSWVDAVDLLRAKFNYETAGA